MEDIPDSIDLDSLSGNPSEDLFEKLLSDPTFVDYLNTFLSLPAMVGRRVGNAIHWVNLYSVDSAAPSVETYPMDTDLSIGKFCALRNWVQDCQDIVQTVCASTDKVFGKWLCYNRVEDYFSTFPPPPRTRYHLPVCRIKKWVHKERLPFFWKTDLFLAYLLSAQLHDATTHPSTSVNSDEARTFLRTVEDMRRLHLFLRGTAGQKIIMFWIDAERYRRVTRKEHRRFSFRKIQAKYLRSGSPWELPEIMKWASLCGVSRQGEHKSSFQIPKSITKRMYLPDSSIFSENVFLPVQKMALERLSSYWLPKFIQHKKIILKMIAEKRGISITELTLQNDSVTPFLEENDELSSTSSEQDSDDSSLELRTSSSERREEKLEEWRKWFWAGIDDPIEGEHKITPPHDMPMELRQAGGIRGHEEISSAPPSSPDPEEREEAELAASSSDTEGLKGNSGSFSSVTRFSLVPSPENLSTSDTDVLRGFSRSFTYGARFLPPLPLKDLSASDPALPTYSNDRWYKTKNTSEEEDEPEIADPEEEELVSLPMPYPPFAKIPSSAPKKLKTLYEALASERHSITEEHDEELYESSAESSSSSRSLSVTPQLTVSTALRQASASYLIPFEKTGNETASVVGEPRVLYRRDSNGEPCSILQGDIDLNLSTSLALTADKLAGGPLREYLKRTREETALSCLQFWEDSQEYLSLREDLDSFSKYHLGKTLIATYIAPDSPRKVAMSSQTRADLMRLLPLERGSQLLSSVLEASLQTVTLPWREFTQSDEDDFIHFAGVLRKSARRKREVKPVRTTAKLRMTNCSKTQHAFSLTVGLGFSGFSYGLDDDDEDEQEARKESLKIPSLRDQQQEGDIQRNRRASQLYGPVTKEGGDASEERGRVDGKFIRPPKPRCFNEVLHSNPQLLWFKRYLSDKQSEAPLMFWQAVENMRTNCKDGKARQARALIITKKYFINIPTTPAEYLHCKAEIIREIPTLDKVTPPLLISAQACVARSLEENWYADFVATFPEDEGEQENFAKYAMRNTLAGVYKMAAHGKTKGMWVMFAHNIMSFQRGIHHARTLREFKAFLKKESKATLEQNLRRHALHPTGRMVNKQLVYTDKLIGDLEFWMEVERFKIQADNAAACARSGNYTLEDENLLLDKARTIVKCFIDSEFPPRIQINITNDVAENIVSLAQTGIVERGLFHKAALQVFTPLMFLWKKYSAELISEPTHAQEFSTPVKNPTSRKRIMSIVGGMPYRKVYAANEDEIRWSFSLSHGLRLTMPLRFVIARRVATRMG